MKEKKEKKDKKDKLSLLQSFKNDLYAMKLSARLSKSRVVHELLNQIFGYAAWVFFSAFFMRYIINALDQKKPAGEIFAFIIICAVFFSAVGLYENYCESVMAPLTNTKIYRGIYKMLYRKAANVELGCYEDADFYNKYTMAAENADTKLTAVVTNLWGILIGLIATCTIFYSMYAINPKVVLFVASPIIGNFFFGYLTNKYMYKRYEENVPNTRVMNYVTRVMYLPDYAKELRLSKVFALLTHKYDKAADDNVRIAGKYAPKIAFLNFWKITFTFTVIFEGVLLYASYCEIVEKSISLAELTVLTSIMVSATWILIDLFENIVQIIKNGLFVKNIREFLEYEEKIAENQNGTIPGEEIDTIEFCNVSFAYKDELTIKNLSFQIKKGEIAAFVGHNGAGKTTIMKLLFRLYDPTEGTVKMNGTDIREYNVGAYRALFAAAFQDYRIFGMSVKDNVLMGKHYDNEDDRVISALRKAGVYDRIEALPEGIDTILTKEFAEDGAVLSGGESQKVVVARAFVKPSPVKVFDEPSSALDPIAEYELYKNIMRDGEGRTMIFISHRLSSVRHADKVFMLEGGSIIEEGTHSDLMKLDGEYAAMYKMQAKNYLAIDDIEGVEL